MHGQEGHSTLTPEFIALDKIDPAASSLALRETGDKGQGVFVAEPLARGAVAIVGKPIAELLQRTWQSLQVDRDTHIKIDLPFEFVNHSCGPNCGVRANSHGAYDLVAMRDIEAGEEITFDYCMTEWLCVGFESCHCRSDRCRRIIRGAKFLPLEKLQEYDGYLAPYLIDLWLDRHTPIV